MSTDRRPLTSMPPCPNLQPHLHRATSPLLARLLDGTHSWGEIEVCADRDGCSDCRLTVYPPGMQRRDRLRLRALRRWPVIGIPSAIAGLVPASQVVHPLAALLIAAVLYGLGAIGLTRLAGSAPRAVRTMRAGGGDDGDLEGDRRRHLVLAGLARRMLDAERDHRTGRIDQTGFEAIWGEVWRALDAPNRWVSTRPFPPRPVPTG